MFLGDETVFTVNSRETGIQYISHPIKMCNVFMNQTALLL